MEITINDAQQKVDEWIKTIGIKYFNELTNLGILMEEVGELSRIMVRKYGEQSSKTTDAEKELADEMADIFLGSSLPGKSDGCKSYRCINQKF